ncbi:hypothetical protein FWF74_02730 [Candidatus Saccharibacteria bacterium]|nr:hypothetical protein [Candidatus Saccharibacteria bacterium]MCL1963413.1 hypothetical protein [Candidatus Saccharibacteria bacterium]
MTKVDKKVTGAGAVFALATVGLVLGLTSAPVGAATITHASSASGTQEIFITPGSEITLDTGATGVTTGALDALGINVSSGSGVSTQQLTVSTNDTKGFTFSISGGGHLTSLDTLSFVKNVSPAAVLADNEWGYTVYRNYVSGTHDAGATYAPGVTTAGSNSAPTVASSTFYTVPASSSILAKTTDNGQVVIWLNYGAKIGATLPTGTTYAKTVTYIASVNP